MDFEEMLRKKMQEAARSGERGNITIHDLGPDDAILVLLALKKYGLNDKKATLNYTRDLPTIPDDMPADAVDHYLHIMGKGSKQGAQQRPMNPLEMLAAMVTGGQMPEGVSVMAMGHDCENCPEDKYNSCQAPFKQPRGGASA
jgi:hypothetical protein